MIKAFFRYYINPFFWGSLIRRKYFIPDMTFKSLIDVNAGRLRKTRTMPGLQCRPGSARHCGTRRSGKGNSARRSGRSAGRLPG